LLAGAGVCRRGRELLFRAGDGTVEKHAGEEAVLLGVLSTEAVLLCESAHERVRGLDRLMTSGVVHVVRRVGGHCRALREAQRRGRRVEPAGCRRRGEGAQLGLATQARLGLEPRALPLRGVAEVRGGVVARGGGRGGRGRVGAGLVRDGVDAHLGEPLLEVRVPVVLDLVVRSLGQVRRDRRPPADRTRECQSFPIPVFISHMDLKHRYNVTRHTVKTDGVND
jgi:hypothetical protein